MSDNEKSTRNELLLALIQHRSRPAALGLVGILALIWLFSARDPLFALLSQAQEVKVGGFSIRLREKATGANLSKEYKRLESLALQQIQLFLIIGAER